MLTKEPTKGPIGLLPVDPLTLSPDLSTGSSDHLRARPAQATASPSQGPFTFHYCFGGLLRYFLRGFPSRYSIVWYGDDVHFGGCFCLNTSSTSRTGCACGAGFGIRSM